MMPNKKKRGTQVFEHGRSKTPRQQQQQEEEEDCFEGTNDGLDAEEVAPDVEMAIAASGSTYGIAAYNALSCSIQCLRFTDDSKSSEDLGCWMQEGAANGNDRTSTLQATLQQVKVQLQPDVIYISSKADLQLAKAAREPLLEGNSNAQIRVLTERASLFQFGQSLKMLSTLSVHGMPHCQTPQDTINCINTLVDLSCEALVSALGALLAVLQGRRNNLALTQDASLAEGSEVELGIVVQSLTELPLQGSLMVDEVSLRSLQIFADELHPSNMGIGKTKEGFSIYGLHQAHCTTLMGKRLLRSWLLRPVVDLLVVTDRQDTVQLLINARDVASAFVNVLKKVQDIPRLLHRVSNSQQRPERKCFKTLHASLTHLLHLRDIVQLLLHETSSAASDWSSVSLSHRLLAHIPDELHTCCQLITDVISFEDEDDEMLVRQGICQELDDLKDIYLGLPDLLTKVLEGELSRIPSFLTADNNTQLWSILYLPQVGYVMQVSGLPLSDELLEELSDYTLFMEGVADDGSPSVYYHTDATKELSTRVGDVLYKVQDLEGTLCTELIKRLLQFQPQLHAAAHVVAELDCLMSFAAVACNQRYCRPKLVQDNVLDIENGRHPLAELVVSTYIPNGISMKSDQSRVHVITGPNASGKSCYIKSIALIAYLAHLGAFVPATKAVVGVVDRIFTRLVSQESSKLQQSTFMIDLSQIAGMLNKATSRSMIICDEFGKGTLTYDGVGLLAATLGHFCNMPQPPRVLACTHFHELLAPSIMPRCEQLAFFTMDLCMPAASNPPQRPGAGAAAAAASDQDSAAVFLYRLVAGHQTPSYGFFCAQMCGVPQDVVSRAKVVARCQEEGTALPLNCSRSSSSSEEKYQALLRLLLELDLTCPTATWKQKVPELLATALAST